METIRWGMIGCGDVAEVKSGPALQKADGSALVAVMRRDRAKAEDYARRHNVPRVHTSADELIARRGGRRRLHRDAAIESLRPCAEGRGRRQAVPGREADGDESRGVSSDGRGVPRRPAPSLGCVLTGARSRGSSKCASCCARARSGSLTSIHVKVTDPLATGEAAKAWRFNTGDFRRGPLSRSRLALLRHHRFCGRTDHRSRRFRAEHRRQLRRRGRHSHGVSDRRQSRGHRRVELQCARLCRLDRVYRITKGKSRRPSAPTRMSSSRAAASPICIASAILRTCTSR